MSEQNNIPARKKPGRKPKKKLNHGLVAHNNNRKRPAESAIDGSDPPPDNSNANVSNDTNLDGNTINNHADATIDIVANAADATIDIVANASPPRTGAAATLPPDPSTTPESDTSPYNSSSGTDSLPCRYTLGWETRRNQHRQQSSRKSSRTMVVDKKYVATHALDQKLSERASRAWDTRKIREEQAATSIEGAEQYWRENYIEVNDELLLQKHVNKEMKRAAEKLEENNSLLQSEVKSMEDQLEMYKKELDAYRKIAGAVQKVSKTKKELKRELLKAQDRAQKAERDLKKLAGIINLGDKSLDEEEKRTRLSNIIRTVFTKLFPRTKNTDRATTLMKCISSGDIFGHEAAAVATVRLSRAYMRMVFEPFVILKEMDMSCEGTFNQSSMKHLSNIEKDGSSIDTGAKRGHSLICPTKSISHCRSLMNKLVDECVEVKRNEEEDKAKHGDYVCVNLDTLIRLLLKGLNLTTKAQTQSVEICFTSDGAKLQRKGNGSHTSGGLKVTDPDAIDPITGEYLFVELETTSDGRPIYKNAQSTTNCALALMILRGETKDVMKDVFKPFYKYGQKIAKEGLPRRGDLPALQPIIFKNTADMKTHWVLAGCGGSFKNVIYACHLCECHKDEDLFAEKHGDDVCELYCKGKRTICRHRVVNDETEVERKKEWLLDTIGQDLKRTQNLDSWTLAVPEGPLEVILSKDGERVSSTEVYDLRNSIDGNRNPTLPLSHYLQHLRHTEEHDRVVKESVMKGAPEQAMRATSNQHIDFDWTTARNPAREETKFNNLVNKELMLRGYKLHELKGPSGSRMNAEERRDLLKFRLSLARKIRQTRNALEIELRSSASRCVEINSLVMCILHLENRTAEGVIYHIIKASLTSVDGEDRLNLKKVIEHEMNVSVFGRTESAGQWEIPIENGEVKKPSLSNSEARAVCDKLPCTIDTCFTNVSEERKQQWATALDLYRSAMRQLRAKESFSDNMIIEFQQTVDEFMDLWHVLTGKDGFGNYMHCLDVGHVADQLWRHRNLYRYSQQGWEAINKIAKKIFFTKTSMGGGRSKSGKLLPILQQFLRQIFWRFGWADDFFRTHVYPREEGEEFCPLDLDKCYNRAEKLSDEDWTNIVESILKLGNDFDDLSNDGDSSELEEHLQKMIDENPDEYNRLMSLFEKMTS